MSILQEAKIHDEGVIRYRTKGCGTYNYRQIEKIVPI